MVGSIAGGAIRLSPCGGRCSAFEPKNIFTFFGKTCALLGPQPPLRVTGLESVAWMMSAALEMGAEAPPHPRF